MHGITTTPKSERQFDEQVFGEGALSSTMQGSIGDSAIGPRVSIDSRRRERHNCQVESL